MDYMFFYVDGDIHSLRDLIRLTIDILSTRDLERLLQMKIGQGIEIGIDTKVVRVALPNPA